MSTGTDLTAELEQTLNQAIQRRGDIAWREDLSRCVPLMVELLSRSHDQSVDHLRSAVRELIVERCVIGSAACCGRSESDAIDRHVELLLAEMERQRRRQCRRGTWSDAPVPPQMFG